MFIVCYYLFFFTHSSSVKHSIGHWAYQSLDIAIRFLCLVLFGSGNVALASLPIININKGRWTQDKQKIFMQAYEKYGNNACKLQESSALEHPLKLKSILNIRAPME
jgi:hypothetical protein